MPIQTINIGSTADDGTGETIRSAFDKTNANFLELESIIGGVQAEPGADGEDGVGLPSGGVVGQVPIKQSATDYDIAWGTLPASVAESISGGTGFTNVSGEITLDFSNAREFHHILTGNGVGPTFANVPNANIFSASAWWVLKIDATGGYSLIDEPAVTWLDGSSWDDLSMEANAVNIVALKFVGDTTFASILKAGSLVLDPYVMSFSSDGAQLIPITRSVTLLLGSVTNLEADGTAGTGTVTFKKNGGANITGNQSFSPGEVLTVTLTGSTTPSAISIPRVV